MQTCNFIKRRLQHTRFPVNFTKVLRTIILKNIFEWLLLKSWNNNEKIYLKSFKYIIKMQIIPRWKHPSSFQSLFHKHILFLQNLLTDQNERPHTAESLYFKTLFVCLFVREFLFVNQINEKIFINRLLSYTSNSWIIVF